MHKGGGVIAGFYGSYMKFQRKITVGCSSSILCDNIFVYPVHGDQVLDFSNGRVSLHLGRIADNMYEWEGSIAEQLGLTRADVRAINTKYPNDLRLQT